MSQRDTEREAIETAASEWLAKRDRGFSPFESYYRRQFVLADRATEAVRVGGLFQIDAVDGCMQLLETGFGITVVREDAGIVIFQLRQ